MAKTANEYKQVKNRMIKPDLFYAVNNRSEGVGRAAGKKPAQTTCGQTVNKRFNGKHDQPAHKYIHQRGNDTKFAGEKQF